MIDIFYDNDRDVVWMSYRREPFAPRTLNATYSNNTITVTQAFNADAVLTVEYWKISDGGNPQKVFISAQQCASYLNAEFAKQRLLSWQFNQDTPTTVWMINHNLSFQPKVMIVDTAGDPVLTDTRYPSLSQVELRFATPTAGIAYLS